jgi:hypothetical protein
MLTFLGDIAFTGILCTQPELNQNRYAEIIPFLKKSDLVFANLEVPVKCGGSRNEYKKLIHFSLPVPTEELLRMMNISCVSLANNHVYDYRMPGLRATIELLDQAGIKHTGAGWLKQHLERAIIDYKGKKIAFMAFVDQSTNPGTEKYPELFINYFNTESVVQMIQECRKQVDWVVCSIHWGVDYSYYPTPGQRNDARRMIDAGADVIMGHHPHTIQPFEIYRNKHILYSLGGLTFGDFQIPGTKNMKAIQKKTKKGVIVNWEPDNQIWNFISTLEKKGNFVVITKSDYRSWSNLKWKFFRIRNSSVIVEKLFRFKEKVIDRMVEYFFGYYKNPIRQMFTFSNLRKIKKLFR